MVTGTGRAGGPLELPHKASLMQAKRSKTSKNKVLASTRSTSCAASVPVDMYGDVWLLGTEQRLVQVCVNASLAQ